MAAAKLRGTAAVDGVGIADDGGTLRLTEHLRQGHGGHCVGAQQIPQHVAGANGGQLIGVPHHHQTAAGLHSLQQRLHQRQVHHAHLVYNDGIGLQRLLAVFLEHRLAGKLVIGHTQRPVDGLGLPAAQLAHALGGTACGSQQQHLKAHALEKGHDAPCGGGLAGAGAAGQQQHAGAGRQLHRLTLLRGIGNALLLLHLPDQLLHAPAL